MNEAEAAAAAPVDFAAGGLWLIYRWRETEPPYELRFRSLNLDLYPAPTIVADGVGAAGPHYWLASEPPAGVMISRSRSTGPRAAHV